MVLEGGDGNIFVSYPVTDQKRLNRVRWFADGSRMEIRWKQGQGYEQSRECGHRRRHGSRRWAGWAKWVPLGVFGLAVLGTWIGVQSRIRRSESPVFFAGRTEMPGYRFQAVWLDQKVAKMLATTRLLNGHFFDYRSNRVSVFQADWKAGEGDGSNLFGHTPETCWVGGGFRRVHLGEPSQVFVELEGHRVPFQCRILTHPGLATQEITLWAACINGQWDDVSFAEPPETRKTATTLRSYVRDLERKLLTCLAALQRVVLRPISVSGPKQFVRLSLPVTHEWPSALADLERFAQAWLVFAPHGIGPEWQLDSTQ